MNELSQVALHPAFQTFFIMLVVILIERWWPISKKYHPLTVYRLIAIRMALKVNPDDKRSEQQQKISGSLAAIMLTVPVLLPIALFIQLADIKQFFDGLLLLFALQFQYVAAGSKRIAFALGRDKKALSRHIINDLCLRQTDNLSTVGICKATIETYLLRYTYQYLAVLFWFICFGGVAALLYRLLFELTQAWNVKQSHFKYFGRPVNAIHAILSWVPSQLMALLFMLAENIKNAYYFRRRLPTKAGRRAKLIATFAGAMNVQLGGPVMYNDVKHRTLKSGPARFPQSQDILRSLAAGDKTLLIWVIITLLLSACLYALNPSLP